MAGGTKPYEMLKYTAPWQVLCSGLERREQPAVNEKANRHTVELDSSSLKHRQDYECELGVTDSSVVTKHQFISTESQQVIKNESVDPPDLMVFETEQNARDVEGNILADRAEVNIYQQNDNFLLSQDTFSIPKQTTSTGAPESTMDRVTRSQIFSLSSAGSTYTLHEEPDLNVISEHSQSTEGKHKSTPDGERKLKLLKEESHFGIRAYLPETSPTKLFENGDDDDVQARSHEFTQEKAWELEKQRRDIIKKQGQRKSLDVDEIIIHRDVMDTSISATDLNEIDSDHMKVNVDTEQINFEAARKQFLMLEKKRNSLPISPRPQSKPPRSKSFYVSDWNSEMQGIEDTITIQSEVRTQSNEPPQTQAVSSSELRKQFYRELSTDDRDGETEDNSKGVNKVEHSQEKPEQIPNPSNETPIEREIRLALEREESLRKERGIQGVGDTKEMVEILKNPVLSQSSDTAIQKKSKERTRSINFLQREIEKDAQREAVLRNEGKVAGLYDKGNVQELDERRKVFEQPDDIPVQPQLGNTKRLSKAATIDLGTSDIAGQADSTQTSENTNWTVLDAPQPYSARINYKPTPLNISRYRRASADNILDFNPPTHASSGVDISAETQILQKENFHIQPWKFRQHGDEEKMQSPKWTEKTQDNANPEEIYKTTRLRPVSSVIEKEIQQTLERDLELKEQRRKSEVPYGITSTDGQITTPVNGHNQYGKTVLSSGGSNRWNSSSQGSASFVSPIQMFRPRKTPKFVVSESDSDRFKRYGDYAGIDSSDDVNTEIVESTRVNRHKNTMALRWEAGIYANNPSD
ncbi:Hypothetical predicted protein [Pelobates cultripes]|uniref:A-kinase anchor protein 2 C-terminal domain-containing protein n=2 Tax=Pelobates cultripes TaxID=61616 RepID=A0AAD1W470_PELCU|nr:Hypothetical predicted protein [Pelobates cultripes]